jgi:hypothetical protein
VLVGIANANNRSVVESEWEALPRSGQLTLAMALVEPTQCEARWRSVLTSFDKEHENLIKNNPDATKEINLVRTGLVKIGQLIHTFPQKNGNGVTWKRLIDKAENEKNVLCKHLDGKALFTGMLRLHAATHKELTESLLPECAQEKDEDAPRADVAKETVTLTMVAPAIGRQQINPDNSRPTKSRGQWQRRITLLR